MSTKRLISPATQRQAEVRIRKAHNTFEGMLRDIPLSEVPVNYGHRNINVIDHGKWFEGRPGSRQYTTATPPTGRLYARYDHKRKPCVMHQYDSEVWISDKALTTFTKVLNLASTSPAATPSQFYELGDEMLLFAGDIYQIFVTEDLTRAYMIRMTNDFPTHVPVDGDSAADFDFVIPHTQITDDGDYATEYALLFSDGNVPSDLTPKHCYQYVYGCATIDGSSSSQTRFNADGKGIVSETGTVIDADDLFQVEQWAFTEAGAEVSVARHRSMLHPPSPTTYPKNIVGRFELPIDNRDATHFSIYRTLDVGDNTNGNNQGLYVWAKDVPVARVVFTTTRSISGSVCLLRSVDDDDVSLSEDDVGSYVECFNTTTNAVVRGRIRSQIRSATNNTYYAVEWDSTVPDVDTEHAVFIGLGRKFAAASITATTTLTINTTVGLGTAFDDRDVGSRITWHDGSYSVIASINSATSVELEEAPTVTGSSLYMFSLPNLDGTYAYRRHWNDRVPDDGVRQGVQGLKQRLEAGDDWYMPLFAMWPHHECNMGIVENGLCFSAQRDLTKVFYAECAAKPFAAGQYRANNQYEDLHGKIRALKYVGGNVSVFMADSVFINNLTNITNVGNTAAGEYIPVIPPFSKVDTMRGVYHWQSIAMANPATMFALTNEPAIRIFSGTAWGESNLATVGGYPAVMSYLENLKDTDGVIGAYSMRDGYLLWFHRYVNSEDVETGIDVVVPSPGSFENWGTSTAAWEDGGSATGDDIKEDWGTI